MYIKDILYYLKGVCNIGDGWTIYNVYFEHCEATFYSSSKLSSCNVNAMFCINYLIKYFNYATFVLSFLLSGNLNSGLSKHQYNELHIHKVVFNMNPDKQGKCGKPTVSKYIEKPSAICLPYMWYMGWPYFCVLNFQHDNALGLLVKHTRHKILIYWEKKHKQLGWWSMFQTLLCLWHAWNCYILVWQTTSNYGSITAGFLGLSMDLYVQAGV